MLPGLFTIFELSGDDVPLLGDALLSDGFISGFGSGLVVIVPALSEVPPLLFEKILPVISTQVAQT